MNMKEYVLSGKHNNLEYSRIDETTEIPEMMNHGIEDDDDFHERSMSYESPRFLRADPGSQQDFLNRLDSKEQELNNMNKRRNRKIFVNPRPRNSLQHK